MIWRLLFSLLTGLALVLTALLDYSWRDKRRVQFKRGRKALLVVLSILWMGGMITVYFEATEGERREQRLSEQLGQLRAGQSDAASNSEQMDTRQRNEIQKLQVMLEPFLLAARRQSPQSDDPTALRALADRLNRLETAAKDRELPVAARAKIAQLLAPHAGSRVSLWVMAADMEGRRYTEMLRQCFLGAGWSVDGPVLVFDKEYPSGLHLVVQQHTDSSEQRAIEAALQATGLMVGGAVNKAVPPGAFRVVVGPK